VFAAPNLFAVNARCSDYWQSGSRSPSCQPAGALQI